MSTNGGHKNISLMRVSMWCHRFYSEAREAALIALAGQDWIRYNTLTREKYEWLSAALVVDQLIDLGGSADDQRI